MNTEHASPSLESILRQAAECSEQLVDCLEAERLALMKRDLEALGEAISDKTRLTAMLETLDAQRQQALGKLGYTADEPGLKACFASLPADSALPALWDRLMINIGKCRNSNIANGGVLESSRQHVEQALGILRGQHGTPTLYSAEGNTAPDLGRRELGKV